MVRVLSVPPSSKCPVTPSTQENLEEGDADGTPSQRQGATPGVCVRARVCARARACVCVCVRARVRVCVCRLLGYFYSR